MAVEWPFLQKSTLLRLYSFSDVALFQTRAWILPHKMAVKEQTILKTICGPLLTRPKDGRPCELKKKERNKILLLFSVKLDHLVSLFSLGSRTSFLLSKVRQRMGLTFTQKKILHDTTPRTYTT